MSSILNKFKNKQPDANPPPGVDLQYTSFGQSQNTYQPPQQQVPVTNTTKTTTQPRQKGRPGGGWDDEPSPPKQQSKPNNTINLITESPIKYEQPTQIKQEVLLPPTHNHNIQLTRLNEYKGGQLLTYEELEIGGFEHEFNITNEVTKLGGIRLKQSDVTLKEFATSVQNIQEQIIGSILLNKLHSEDNWKIQIRCIYAIIHISQQFQTYREFFRINQQYIQVPTDQQMLQSAIDQALSEVNGIQVTKKEEVQFEFREPPKQQQQFQLPQQQQQQQQNDILDLNEGTQQKKDAFRFMKKPQTQQQQSSQSTQSTQQQYIQPQQYPAQPQQTTNVDLLSTSPIVDAEPKKAKAFGFIKKTQPATQQPQQQQPTQISLLADIDFSQPMVLQQQQQPIPVYVPPQPPQYQIPQAFQSTQYTQQQYHQQPQPQPQKVVQQQPKKYDDKAFDFLNM